MAERMRAQGVKVELIGPARGKLSRHPGIRPVLCRLIAEADVVHIHAVWEQIQHEAAREARRQGKPYIVTLHGMLSRWSMVKNALGKRMYLVWRVRRDLNVVAVIHYATVPERDRIAARGNIRTP